MNVNVVEHPLIQHKLTLARDVKCQIAEFKTILHEIGLLMAYEVTKSLETTPKFMTTPVSKMEGTRLVSHPILVTILRAGIGMLNPFMELLPNSKVGFLGMDRDEVTLEPRSYYDKIPKDALHSKVFLIDPMLATGGSAINALDFLTSKGVNDISFICLVAAPEGVKRINQAYPHIAIYTAALDEKLNEKGYIVPGLGDAGDRIFGTGDDENL